MTAARVNEGDLIAIPLRRGGYCLALVGRHHRQSREMHIFCFGPRLFDLPEAGAWQLPRRGEEIYRTSASSTWVGDDREWKRLGAVPGFRRDDWLISEFLVYESGTGRRGIIAIDDEDISECGDIRPVPPDVDLVGMPVFGICGAGSIADELLEGGLDVNLGEESLLAELKSLWVAYPDDRVPGQRRSDEVAADRLGVFDNDDATMLIETLHEEFGRRWTIIREVMRDYLRLTGYDELPLANEAVAGLALAASAVDPGVGSDHEVFRWWGCAAHGRPPATVITAGLEVAARVVQPGAWWDVRSRAGAATAALAEIERYATALREACA